MVIQSWMRLGWRIRRESICRTFWRYSIFRQDRGLESKMGPQIPPSRIATKVWVLGVYNNVAEYSFARVGCSSLGKAKNHNVRKYGTVVDSTKNPAFLQPGFQCGSRLTPSSIIHHLRCPKQQKTENVAIFQQ